MVKYKSAIFVRSLSNSFRKVIVGTNFSNRYSNYFDFNQITYEGAKSLLEKIDRILEGYLDNKGYGIEWQGGQLTLEFFREKTIVEENFWQGKVYEVPTEVFKQIINERIKFADSLDESKIFENIRLAFLAVRRNRNNYHLYDLIFNYGINDFEVLLSLTEDDFSSSTDKFLSTIKIDERFLSI